MSRKRVFGPIVEPSGILLLPLYFFSFIGALLVTSNVGFNESTLIGLLILLTVCCFLFGAFKSERNKNSYFGGRLLVVFIPLGCVLSGFAIGIFKWFS